MIPRNAEPVVYAEPPADEGHLGGDQEYYNSKRKAPMSDDENDEDYGGKFHVHPPFLSFGGSCAVAC